MISSPIEILPKKKHLVRSPGTEAPARGRRVQAISVRLVSGLTTRDLHLLWCSVTGEITYLYD